MSNATSTFKSLSDNKIKKINLDKKESEQISKIGQINNNQKKVDRKSTRLNSSHRR